MSERTVQEIQEEIDALVDEGLDMVDDRVNEWRRNEIAELREEMDLARTTMDQRRTMKEN